MSFCAIHRMPVGARGCPQCLREEVVSRRVESAGFWRWAGIVFGAIAVLAVLTVLLLPSPAATPRLLDPDPFRAAIERVENALYSTERLTAEERVALEEGLFALEMGLRKLRPSPAKRRALDPYVRFCTLTAFEAKSDSFDVPAARKEWESLRRAYFKPAPWFRASSNALQQAQTSASARGIPADAGLYQPAIDRLRLVQARAETELAALPDDPYEIDSDVYERWRAARGEVQADLDRLRREYPVAFSGMEPGWRRAFSDLETATREVGGLMGATTRTPSLVPTSSEGSARILRARARVDQAQASLDAAPR